jgi:DNA-binding GntR family transcriptional regulator
MRAIGLAPPTPAAPRVNLAEQVYAALKQRMHDFEIVPGDRFSEAELGQRLGVSRTPVREALFRLRNEGLMDVDGKNGWYVRPIDFARIEELYELRVLIEAACVERLCTMEPAPEGIDALKAVWLVPVAERVADGRRVGELDEAFHATLVQAAGNGEMARVHLDVTERIRIVRRLDFTRDDRIEATYQEHAKILRQIIQRRAEPALLCLRSHIRQSQVEVRRITLHALYEARAQQQGVVARGG